ncbi:glycine zipper family protein [Vibrio cortegadensis]|uniref:glycine zipper family protein n=1 Tax=Vibrio cortegadensis TaxID=1328770 RepID=UPI00352E7EE9
MKKIIWLLAVTSTLSACAYNQKPVVDMTGVDANQYDQDFKYCQSYAEQVDKAEAAKTEAKNSAVTGAVVGALVGVLEDGVGGAAVGAVAGGAVGAGAGAATGANDATAVQSKVLRRCLVKKGYTVYDAEV